MPTKSYIVDRVLHWSGALLLLFMLMNLSTQLHNVDWDIKGQLEHRQDAVETHALIGGLLVLVTLFRIVFPYLTKTKLPRVVPKSPKHGLFIHVTHLAMYLCIFLLVVTGIGMVNHYEIPLSVYGFELAPNRDDFYAIFPDFHYWHMLFKQTIWWLIGIHFVGIMYAKR